MVKTKGPPKPGSKNEHKNQVKLLLQDKNDVSRIAEITGLDRSTIYRLKKEILAEKKSSKPPGNLPSGESQTGIVPSPEDLQGENETDDEQGKFTDENILQSSVDKAAGKIATELSGIIQEEYVRLIKSGATLQNMEREYRESIEAMGCDWDDFIAISLEHVYKILLDNWERRGNMITIEDVVAMKMAGKLATTDYGEES